MLFFKKIKASALQYTLVISVIIALVVFTFITLLFLQKRLQLKNSNYITSVQNTLTAFNYLSSQKKDFNFLEQETNLTLKQWGIFEIATIKSAVKKEEFKKIGLLGYQNKKRKALYLQENNKPLAVVGNTKIVGSSAIPKQGVKSGNIAGNSYNGQRLIYGGTTMSSFNLPEINNYQKIENIFNEVFLNDSIRFVEIENTNKLTNSFFEPTLLHQSPYVVHLNDVSLIGNIIIASKSSIVVSSSAILKDIILIAPKIIINENVTGNFQAFAKEEILLKEGSVLSYPSAIVLIDKKKDGEEKPKLTIEDNCIVKGVVLYASSNDSTNFTQQLVIGKRTTVFGDVYCNQNLELLGNVYGSVYVNHFITKQSGSIYVNHLYNAEINSLKLPKEFCGLPIESTNVNVAKWLY